MSYIIAHITENAIDIIDDESVLKFETETLENIIKSGNKNFARWYSHSKPRH